MATIITRAGKGSPLTQAEVDQNFINLNTDKLDTVGGLALGSAASPSLSFTGDLNTGIYSPGADQVAVATNGTGRLFVDGNGQVSVVCASNWNFPGLLLRRTASNTSIAKQLSFLLDGDTESETTLTNYLNIWGTYSGTPTTSSTSTALSASINLGAPNAFIAHTNGSERLRITSTGLVGIGTSSPTTALHVVGTVTATISSNWNFPGLLLRRTASNVATAKQISFLLDGDTESDTTLTNYLNIWGTYSGTPTTSSTSTGLSASMNLGAPNAFIAHTNGSERLRIDSSGRLLVGTSSDSGGALLQVNDDRIRVGTAKTPATSGATGTTGEIAWDANYIYVCTATNTWKRSAIATW